MSVTAETDSAVDVASWRVASTIRIRDDARADADRALKALWFYVDHVRNIMRDIPPGRLDGLLPALSTAYVALSKDAQEALTILLSVHASVATAHEELEQALAASDGTRKEASE